MVVLYLMLQLLSSIVAVSVKVITIQPFSVKSLASKKIRQFAQHIFICFVNKVPMSQTLPCLCVLMVSFIYDVARIFEFLSSELSRVSLVCSHIDVENPISSVLI
ncbi:hypothetical protein Bca4012_020154 [Brassica carinata]